MVKYSYIQHIFLRVSRNIFLSVISKAMPMTRGDLRFFLLTAGLVDTGGVGVKRFFFVPTE